MLTDTFWSLIEILHPFTIFLALCQLILNSNSPRTGGREKKKRKIKSRGKSRLEEVWWEEWNLMCGWEVFLWSQQPSMTSNKPRKQMSRRKLFKPAVCLLRLELGHPPNVLQKAYYESLIYTIKTHHFCNIFSTFVLLLSPRKKTLHKDVFCDHIFV